MCVSLQEFFQDIDSFEIQSRDHISQLETTLQLLLRQQEGLLGDGKGAGHLLENVVEEIREGYKVVEDQVSRDVLVGVAILMFFFL